MNENKKPNFLDLKVPLGGLLVFYGIILDLYGFFSNKDIYHKSLGVNINLIWGTVILVLGVILLFVCLRKKEKNG